MIAMARSKFTMSTEVALTIVFWGSVAVIILSMILKILWPSISFADVGLSQKNVIGYCITATSACLWYPIRKKIEGKKALIPLKELYARLIGMAIGAVLIF
jgi:hypothetical protein